MELCNRTAVADVANTAQRSHLESARPAKARLAFGTVAAFDGM